MSASYNSNSQKTTIALDDLPTDRLREALALIRFLKAVPLKWFVVGSYSANVALDLQACGILKLHRDWDGPVETLQIISGGQ